MTLVHPFFIFLFLPICLALLWTANRLAGRRGALVLLLVASLLFIATQGVWLLLVVFVSGLLNYLFLRFLIQESRLALSRGLVLVAGVGINILLLILVKYAVWLQWIPIVGGMSRDLSLLIPTTLSFLTFQRAVALLDGFSTPVKVRLDLGVCSEPKSATVEPLMRFFNFVLFFPNLLIGPIAYISEVAPQFARKSFAALRRIDLAIGLTLIAIGLAKKFVLADRLGADWVDPVYARMAVGEIIARPDAFGAVIAYYVQLYFDFSGYSDIALGVARLIGIRLPINFDSPLRATGIIDFYRRWHITLTRVIARFLFTPLSIAGTRFAARRRLKGIRAKAISLWGPLLLNFTMIGVWHGPKLTFVAFGVIHGCWYVIETEFKGAKWHKAYRKSFPDRGRSVLAAVFTVPLLMITFSLFRSPTLGAFGHLLSFVATGPSAPSGPLQTLPTIRLISAYAIAFLAPNAYEVMRRYRPGIRTYNNRYTTPGIFAFRWRPTMWWGMLVALLALIAMREMATVTPFVYQVY